LKEHLFDIDKICTRHAGLIIHIRLFHDADVAAEIDLQWLVAPALLAGQYNYAIGRPGTPDARRSSIFQHGHTFNVVGIDIQDISFKRKIIQHNERLHVGKQRTLPTDVDLKITISVKQHARHNAVQLADNIG